MTAILKEAEEFLGPVPYHTTEPKMARMLAAVLAEARRLEEEVSDIETHCAALMNRLRQELGHTQAQRDIIDELEKEVTKWQDAAKTLEPVAEVMKDRDHLKAIAIEERMKVLTVENECRMIVTGSEAYREQAARELETKIDLGLPDGHFVKLTTERRETMRKTILSCNVVRCGDLSKNDIEILRSMLEEAERK